MSEPGLYDLKKTPYLKVILAKLAVRNAGDLQVKNARLGGIFNMGGTSVANYVSILERIK